jgi:hypothetical protein
MDDDDENDGSLNKKSDPGKTYVRFPFKCASTKKLESCCNRLHVLNSFSPGHLPLTDREFDPQTNFATPSGCINEEMRMNLTSDCWLQTDGTSFLYAWLTRSKECCGHFLVVPSQVTRGDNRIIIDVVLLHYRVHIHLPANRTTRVKMQGCDLLPWVDVLFQNHFCSREVGV